MNPKILFLILLGIAVTLEVAGDVFFKKWVISSRAALLAVGLLLYFMGTTFWAFSLKHEHLSVAISFFTVVNLLAVSALGIYLFNEQLSMTNKLGIILGIISVILLLK